MTLEAKLAGPYRGRIQEAIVLDAYASTGADAYAWRIVRPAAPAAALSDAHGPVTFLVAQQPGVYLVELRAQAGEVSDTALAVVHVEPVPLRLEGPARIARGSSAVYDARPTTLPEGVELTWAVSDENGQPSTGLRVRPDATSATVRGAAEGRHRLEVRATADVFTGRAFETVELASARLDVEVGAPSTTPPVTDDDKWWLEKQTSATRGLLDDLGASAAKWQGFTTTLIGLFGTVAFVAGPKTLADVQRTEVAYLALGIITVAFVAALVGLFLLARVASATPGIGPALPPEDYRNAHFAAAESARRNLQVAKVFTVAAAVLVAGGSLVLGFASVDAASAPDPPSKAIVRTGDTTICGELGSEADGDVTIAGVAVGPVEELLLVTSCGD